MFYLPYPYYIEYIGDFVSDNIPIDYSEVFSECIDMRTSYRNDPYSSVSLFFGIFDKTSDDIKRYDTDNPNYQIIKTDNYQLVEASSQSNTILFDHYAIGFNPKYLSDYETIFCILTSEDHLIIYKVRELADIEKKYTIFNNENPMSHKSIKLPIDVTLFDTPITSLLQDNFNDYLQGHLVTPHKLTVNHLIHADPLYTVFDPNHSLESSKGATNLYFIVNPCSGAYELISEDNYDDITLIDEISFAKIATSVTFNIRIADITLSLLLLFRNHVISTE